MISITDVAKSFKITVRTVRYYEQLGLIETSMRIGGKRFFKKEYIVTRMEEIIFLKSLGLTLAEIKRTLADPLYIKVLLVNIQAELLQVKINHLKAEEKKLESILKKMRWPKIKLNNVDIMKKMSTDYYRIAALKQEIEEHEDFSPKTIKRFIHYYKKWYENGGFTLTDSHLALLAFDDNAGVYDDKLKKLFRKYFENN